MKYVHDVRKQAMQKRHSLTKSRVTNPKY